jgi:hypothetical protein
VSAAGVLAALGGGAFVLASLVLGGRLMWLSTRTGEIPERVMGFGLFLMGGVSYPLMLVALLGEGLAEGTRVAMVVAQMLFNTAGMTALAWFNRRVFRPHEAWSAVLVALVAVGYLGAAALQILGPGVVDFLETRGGPWQLSGFVSILATGWGAFESLRYHALLRRRMELGLAQPVVADRFRLWGVAMGCAAFITLVSQGLEAMGIAVNATVVGGLLVGSLGLVIAVSLWLAFFPPQAYLARVEARAAG